MYIELYWGCASVCLQQDSPILNLHKQTRCISNNNNNSQSMAQEGQMKCGVYCVWTKGSIATSGNAESVAWMIIDLVFTAKLLATVWGLGVHITSKMICHQPERTMHVTSAVPWARQAKLCAAISPIKEATTATHMLEWNFTMKLCSGTYECWLCMAYLKWTQLQCAWLVPYGSWSLIIYSLIPSPQPQLSSLALWITRRKPLLPAYTHQQESEFWQPVAR